MYSLLNFKDHYSPCNALSLFIFSLNLSSAILSMFSASAMSTYWGCVTLISAYSHNMNSPNTISQA